MAQSRGVRSGGLGGQPILLDGNNPLVKLLL